MTTTTRMQLTSATTERIETEAHRRTLAAEIISHNTAIDEEMLETGEELDEAVEAWLAERPGFVVGATVDVSTGETVVSRQAFECYVSEGREGSPTIWTEETESEAIESVRSAVASGFRGRHVGHVQTAGRVVATFRNEHGRAVGGLVES